MKLKLVLEAMMGVFLGILFGPVIFHLIVEFFLNNYDRCITVEDYQICNTFSNRITYVEVDGEFYLLPFGRPKVIYDESKSYSVKMNSLPRTTSLKKDMIQIHKNTSFDFGSTVLSGNNYEFVCPDDFGIPFNLCLSGYETKYYFSESVGFYITVMGNMSLDGITITKLDK